jgi:hypothetical protein
MIDRIKLLYRLEEQDFMNELHRTIKEGLVGTLRNEYMLKKPIRVPYEVWNQTTREFLAIPVFHAVVDMMTANLLHSTGEKFINLICDVIEKEGLSNPAPEKG